MLNNDGKYSDISFQPNNEKVSLLLAVKTFKFYIDGMNYKFNLW